MSKTTLKPIEKGVWANLAGHELERTYHFPDGSSYTVKSPKNILVCESGQHLLVDSEDTKHIIRKDWNAISFKGNFLYE